jgi:hypothetical protein
MVKRLTKMSKLNALRNPSVQSAIYIQEAARTYIYGFMQSSTAMSRAALEQALKEQLAHQGTGAFIDFQALVDKAKKWNILGKNMARAVRESAKKADRVLHEAPTDESGAFEVLCDVRALLQKIYDSEGGF